MIESAAKNDDSTKNIPPMCIFIYSMNYTINSVKPGALDLVAL